MGLESYDAGRFLCNFVSEARNASIDKLLNWIIDRIEYTIKVTRREILLMPTKVQIRQIYSTDIVRNALK